MGRHYEVTEFILFSPLFAILKGKKWSVDTQVPISSAVMSRNVALVLSDLTDASEIPKVPSSVCSASYRKTTLVGA
jgi:hypothetical protein